MLDYGLMAPTMFAGLVVFLLIGFPVAFSLSALGLAFGFVAIEVGYFGPEFLQALPYRTFGIMSNDLLLAIPFFTFMGAILERSGLLRTQETQRTMRRIVLSVGGLLVAIACVRIVVRAAISGSAPFPAYLTIAMCGVVGITIWMSVGNDVSSATCGYRVWLESATHSLRADVSSYRRRHIDDIAVAVAIGGVVVLMYHPEMAAYAAHMQAQAAANTSSSTCSSSCGGGGGGCGGGCGGGGGCS